MENEEIFENYTENVLESSENLDLVSPSEMDSSTQLEQTDSLPSSDNTLEILTDMISDYLDEKGYISEMENIPEREVSEISETSENESILYPFQFSEDGFLQTETVIPFQNILDKPLVDYTVSETLLLCIFFLLLSLVVKNFLFTAHFFRKGWY